MTTTKPTDFYGKLYQDAKRILLAQILEGSRSAILMELSLFQSLSQSVMLLENDMFVLDKCTGSEGVFPDMEYYDFLKICLNANENILNGLIETLCYADLRFYAALFLFKTVNQCSQIKYYFRLLNTLAE